MKHFKVQILVTLFLPLYTDIFSQSIEKFDDVLSSQKVGKVFVRKAKQDISERTFLGYIKDSKGHISYYVVKEFLRVKAAVVYHGHSRILFFDKEKKLVLESILSMPYELPFKLKDNQLYFTYIEGNKKLVFVENVAILKKMLCVAPKSCYDIAAP